MRLSVAVPLTQTTKTTDSDGIDRENDEYATVRRDGDVFTGRIKSVGYDGERYLLVHDLRRGVERVVRPEWEGHQIVETSAVAPNRGRSS